MSSMLSLPAKSTRFAFALFFIFATLFSVAIPVSADMGPKEYTLVSVKGIPDKMVYYGTLLSAGPGGGPNNKAFSGDPRLVYNWEDRDSEGYDINNGGIWLTFVEFEDPDGYYYLQEHYELKGNDTFTWGYYPPESFKVLLYFPEYDSFVISEIENRYAFDSIFKINLAGVDYQTPGTTTIVQAMPDNQIDVLWLLDVAVRIVLTLAIELLIALGFGFREKSQLKFIGIVNIITQILMNVAFLYFRFQEGLVASTAIYFVIEFGIFLIEAVLYAIFLKGLSKKPISRFSGVLYSFVANGVSFIVGLLSIISFQAIIL